jgi:DNA-binding response OmpR family regulator
MGTASIPMTDDEPAEAVRVFFLQADPQLAEGYRLKLELDGYQVTVANPSDDALENLRCQPPDIIFLDASSATPGNSGLLQSLRDHPTTRRVPVLLLSNRTAGELARDGMNLGPLDYVVAAHGA